MNKNKVFKWIVAILAIGTLTLLFFYFRNTIWDIVKLTKGPNAEQNEEKINELLRDKGIWGLLTVPLIEALQMIVVFISAEPIQIASGISYDWWLSILLCDLGVCVGATIIFFLVRIFKLNPDSKATKKIEDISKKTKKKSGMQALMYLLFVMPIIPFGAICYFASNSKIKYRKYIFTVATGVIPSIVTSMFMGKLFIWCTSTGISIWILILSIIGVAAILFICAMFILKKCFLNDEGSIDSYFYNVLLAMFGLLCKLRKKVVYHKNDFNSVDGPFIIVSNHASFFDFYYSAKLVWPKRVHTICNRFYFRNRFARFVFKKIEIIPKKLFNPDIETIKDTIKYVKRGESILIYPEGRLSVDGTSYNVVEGTGALIKKLGITLVISRIEGANLSKPKWRKKNIRSRIDVSVVKVVKPEDLATLSPIEIESIINENIAFNDYQNAIDRDIQYKSKNKALGLENILYYCPNCGEIYTMESNNNTLECSHCHTKFTIDDHYGFEENEFKIKNIHDYYLTQGKYENDILNTFNDDDIIISQDVDVEIKNMTNKKLDKKTKGICTLSKTMFTFTSSENSDYNFSYTIKQLNALAFSAGIEFECYHNDYLYYFYPTENRRQCVRWALLTDEMRKIENNE